ADGSSADGALQGDADCSESIDSLDALAALRFAAGAEPFAGCVEQAGDVNCDGDVNEGDVLLLLRFVGGLSPAQPSSAACPPIGEPLDATATTAPPGTATATPPSTTATATSAPGATPTANGYHLETVISGEALGDANGSVIELAMIPGAPTEAIAVRQSGQMYRVSLDGSFAPQAWGDVSGIVDAGGGEEGLLSLAFSPSFAQDGRVYLYYTAAGPDRSVLARYSATASALDGDSAEVLLSIPQFAPNHNGGHIAFDQSEYLLLSTGDGGGGGDPNENGQALDTLLGKVLRIDVSPGTGYAIPGGNPFADGPGGNADEIFAYGLRNPWRMTVDRLTGDVWLGDVGQELWEEIDHVVIGGNYGWDCYEGFAEYEIPGAPDQCTGKVFSPPRAVYDHDLGIAVTGGFVYRGSAMPELYGWYVFGDFYTGRIWAVNTLDNSPAVLLADEQVNIASFAELPNGELLIVSYTDGMYQLARD
ncbi:MAG: PQQ-dependent sugar dehydrogenase, partial [Chloroflexi bacterium]|nr:PQQ-dependent sugar dehydrogenase [Chloroflexota bacterium]